MTNEELRFIDKLYKDLYLEEAVTKHGTGNQYDKFDNIRMHMERLEDIHSKASEIERRKELLKRMYYAKYIIKPEDIPESYYEHQQEIALERGYGHVELTDSQRKEYQEQIIKDQKASLDVWIDYLMSEDAMYPFWAKYWAFQGMLKLGGYNKEKEEYGRRTKDTVAPFADLNPEALALSIDLVIKSLNKEQIEDKDLEALVKSGSFGKIYSYSLTKLLKNNENVTKRNEGKWVKYNRGSDHMPLVNSLQGYNTGWCTAGEATAKTQLSNGDFYVYYTLDENDEYKVPRIAIRMEGNKIGEIRGIAKNQNLESEMEEVVEEKIKDFPDKEEYYKKVADMKELTKIYKKHKNKEELTKEELRFLYEVHDEILGFGHREDPRIVEIIEERNINEDYFDMFDPNEEYVGDITIKYNVSGKYLSLPKKVIGNLVISNLTNEMWLKLPSEITGNLELPSITFLSFVSYLKLPDKIGGNLNLENLTCGVENIEFPNEIRGDLNLKRLASAEDLELPNKIGGSLYLNGLTSAEGLKLPDEIRDDLNLERLASAEDLELPNKIGGSLYLNGLTTAEGLKLPDEINGSLYLSGLITAEGLKLPNKIGRSLFLDSLTTAENLEFPDEISGSIFFFSLTTTKGLELPKKIAGNLYLNCLMTAEGLELPDEIGGKLVIGEHEYNQDEIESLKNKISKR